MNFSKDNSNQLFGESETVAFHKALRRMVDGELPHAERAALLRGLPLNSPRWRDIALAFVEQQVWKESLAPTEFKLDSNALDRVVQTSSSSAASAPAPNLSRPINARWIIAVSACLLFGFLAGRFWPGLDSYFARERVATIGQATARFDGPRLDGDERPEQVAQVLSETLNRSGGPIPLAIRREMMRCGYVIIEQDRYSTIQIPGGKTLELPIRNVAVTYLGNSAYQ